MKQKAFFAWPLVALLAGCASGGSTTGDHAPAPIRATTTVSGSAGTLAGPDATYWIYVGAEAADRLHRIRFGPEGAVIEKTTATGERVRNIEGPHGLMMAPDGRHLFLTTGHGVPDGKFYKIETGPDTAVARGLDLGKFPASLDVTPDGDYALVVNFNLYGEMTPSTVSVVYTPDLYEVMQIETCTMPHGSRINARGTRHYSSCMMDDQLVEIDLRTFEVSRRFSVAKGEEGPLASDDLGHHAGHRHHGRPGAMMHPSTCSPTWAQPSRDGSRIFVACNRSDEILEISYDRWEVVRRFPTGRGPYNLDVTPDDAVLVVTLKQGDAVQFIDLTSGTSITTIPNSGTVTHGVVISPDGRYAFVSVEGVGAEPGKVDIFDLRAFELVESVAVRQQASGIAFWRMEPASPH